MVWQYRKCKNKYKNEISESTLPELSGRSFPSRLERDRATELVLLQRAGQIRKLQFQVTVYLTDAQIGYRPDFLYEEKRDGKWRLVAEDSKGIETDTWLIKRKLWRHYGMCMLRVTKRSGTKIRVAEEIIPK